MRGESNVHRDGDLVWILGALYDDEGDHTHFVGPGILLESNYISISPEDTGCHYWTVAANEGIWNCFEDGLEACIPTVAA